MVNETQLPYQTNTKMERNNQTFGNNTKLTFPLQSPLLNENIKPFIPKNYRLKLNTEKNQILENKINLEMLNLLKKERKDSSCVDNYSTSDEMSPEKYYKKKVHNSYKKKGEKVPFKGEAKDFKIKYKTELCKFYEINGQCKYGDNCAYAHGKENLRSKVTNTTAYRTKKCSQFFETGYCPYGSRCQFAHQLKTNIINNPYDKEMSYTKILEIISKSENVDNIKKLVDKPRLPVFEEICKGNKDKTDIESRLFNDIKKVCKKGLYQRIEVNK